MIGKLQPKSASRTDHIHIAGGTNYSRGGGATLKAKFGLEKDISDHLNDSYGDRAPKVAAIANEGFDARLDERHPYIEAEVIYGVKEESARTPVDILCRRTRLFFLDRNAALRAVPRVTALVGEVLGWSSDEQTRQAQEAILFLQK